MKFNIVFALVLVALLLITAGVTDAVEKVSNKTKSAENTLSKVTEGLGAHGKIQEKKEQQGKEKKEPQEKKEQQEKEKKAAVAQQVNEKKEQQGKEKKEPQKKETKAAV